MTELPAGQNAGRMRLVRMGAAIESSIAAPGSDMFLPVAKQVVGGEEVMAITLVINSESQHSSAKITLNELSIRGPKSH